MRLTNKRLRQLIKEELQKELQLNEQSAASIVTRAASAAKSRPNNQMAFAWVALDHMAEMLDKLNAKQGAPAQKARPAARRLKEVEEEPKEAKEEDAASTRDPRVPGIAKAAKKRRKRLRKARAAPRSKEQLDTHAKALKRSLSRRRQFSDTAAARG